ncbi:MAG: type I glyceraldehyde-3-phosphate dehydrogenase [Candidatus Sumerlaeia bacterium]|nr:type I glyceraldehyde-3-phosphate dehydrogenase [Candidatus Sumerlaeia bacterium]
MTIKIAINGFGRIGRLVARAVFERGGGNVEVVSINDLAPVATNAHLFKYDSVHGVFPGEVSVDGDNLVVNGKKIRATAERDPQNLPHDQLGVDYVIESTGIFTDKAKAALHLKGGVKRVIISAPSNDADYMVVLGVNEKNIPADAKVISNASCTTNCLAPMVKALHDKYGVVKGLVTTIHSYTNDQSVLDIYHKDLRRARAAALNQIPSTTGAAKAIGKVIPELNGKLDGLAIRVPTPNVSLVDFVAHLNAEPSKAEVNAVLKAAAESGQLSPYLDYSELPLVSSDLNHNPASCTIDAQSTFAIGNMVKVLGWYDNEWGYSNRCVDLVKLLG